MKGLAWFISILFHPLFIATYLLILLLLIDPYLFGVNTFDERMPLILLIFFSTFVIPAFATFLIVKLGLAKSFTMEDKMDRTGPLIVSGVFYLWVYWNLYSNPDIPRLFTVLILGATIGLFAVFFFNIFYKISAHMTGMGGWIGSILVLTILAGYTDIIFNNGQGQMGLFGFLIGSIIVSGLVASSRLYLKAHTLGELSFGFVVGIASPFIAYYILL